MPSKAVDRARAIADEPFQIAGTTSAVGGGSGGFVASLAEILRHRELLRLLVGRELKSRYKDSSLGFVWSLVRPLIMLLIYYVAIGQILGASRGVPNFAIFVFSGLTLWGLFSEIVTAGTTSILGNGGLIKKVYLPREIFPVAAIGSALFNFGVQFVVLIAGAVLTGSLIFGVQLLYIVPALAIVLVYGLALALALSALNVYLRDVQFLVEVGLQIFFWLSPIVYAWNFVVAASTGAGHGWAEQLYLINPISNAILAFQRAIWGDGSRVSIIDGKEIAPQVWPPDMELRLLIVLVVGLVFVWIGHRIFRRLEGNFAQEI
ncbi:sugar ABC transporter [Rathayibacter sp. AY1B7]|uniref:ABC transporter permease n=1 Tax=unclassified Rathayibacter TaxID=2609250 RepID=UPI000CE8B436|nr:MULTISPECIES: ABC transporter permease [unclassified Rathayibacter]PPH18636.1 sugar ABC transporter [Rathayibacter sp. AY1F8]PPH22365.1 sugar ABC transporter [Rathayibacter sp. AY1C4]PPH75526.1 sugar ABC transporter [Rathayibacter sp. AY1D4]PPH99510.1 sugar ABC transporter [Rathayibacter sp. AY1B7]